MAKVKAVKNDGDLDNDYIDDVGDIDDELTQEEESFERVLMELDGDSGGVQVHLYREKQGRINGAHLFALAPHDFDMLAVCDRLREEYGAGDYRAVLKCDGRVVKSSPIAVELSKLKTVAPVAGQSDNFDKFMAMMAQQNIQLQRDAQEARKEAQAATQRTHEMMLAMINNKGNEAPRSSTSEILEAVALLKQTGGGTDDAIESLMKGIELGKELSGDGGKDDGMFSNVVKGIAPLLAQAAQANALKTRPQPKQVVKAVKQPALPQQNQQVSAAPDADTDEFNAMVKMLRRACAKEADPSLYAEVVLDQLGDVEAISLFSDDVKYSMFLAIVPDVDPVFKQWLDEMRAEVVALVNTDLQDDTDGPTISDIDTGDGSEITS